MTASRYAGISFCGIVCEGCPIYMATIEPDKEKQLKMRQEIVNITNEHYKGHYKVEDMTDCLGCRSTTGPIFGACQSCNIRNCAMERQVESCAYCRDYPCKYLDAIFDQDQDTKHRLDVLHAASRKKG